MLLWLWQLYMAQKDQPQPQNMSTHPYQQQWKSYTTCLHFWPREMNGLALLSALSRPGLSLELIAQVSQLHPLWYWIMCPFISSLWKCWRNACMISPLWEIGFLQFLVLVVSISIKNDTAYWKRAQQLLAKTSHKFVSFSFKIYILKNWENLNLYFG